MMTHLFFTFAYENRFVENDSDFLALDNITVEENPIQSHASALEAPINLINECILASVECISRVFLQIVNF